MNQLKTLGVAISLIPGVGNVLARQLISYCGSPEGVFRSNKKKILQIPGIGPRIASAIGNRQLIRDAEEIVSYCDRHRIKILHYLDPSYPDRLKQLYDAPSVLYYQGSGELNPSRTVGIVGTRRATAYGLAMVEEIVRELRQVQAVIISGLAYGIDHQAHLSALKEGLPGLAVIAGGLTHIYPSRHIRTARSLMQSGGVMAEHPPLTKPEAHFFPERNRIIAGLSDALIVVEAAERGGALITAEYANNYNREVFAVPGYVHARYSNGCNRLIRLHKAHIYTGLHDLEYIMNWDVGQKEKQATEPDWNSLSIPERRIVEVFRANDAEIMIDELSWKSQIPLNQLASHLLNLEFRGLVKALPGKKYRFLY